jgi:non-ribosomal peptide synthetase component F
LPLDGPDRAERAGGAEAAVRTNLSEEATRALRARAAEARLTLSTLLLGAWALLLRRYSGQSDVVFGVVVSGRPAELPGVESMVGLFINTLPARVTVPASAPLASFLSRVQARQAEREQHAASPLVEIQRWSAVPRGQPLLESLVIFDNYPIYASLEEGLDGVMIRDARFAESTGYPLTVVGIPGPALGLRILFDPGRFRSAAVERVLRHLATLLERMGEGLDRDVGEIDMITADERAALRAGFNDDLEAGLDD